MIRYTVVWLKTALEDLAESWINSPDRSAVTAAVRRIDGQLGEDAFSKGIELSEGLRTVVVHPLRVLFAVRDADRIVEVVRVRPA